MPPKQANQNSQQRFIPHTAEDYYVGKDLSQLQAEENKVNSNIKKTKDQNALKKWEHELEKIQKARDALKSNENTEMQNVPAPSNNAINVNQIVQDEAQEFIPHTAEDYYVRKDLSQLQAAENKVNSIIKKTKDRNVLKKWEHELEKIQKARDAFNSNEDTEMQNAPAPSGNQINDLPAESHPEQSASSENLPVQLENIQSVPMSANVSLASQSIHSTSNSVTHNGSGGNSGEGGSSSTASSSQAMNEMSNAKDKLPPPPPSSKQASDSSNVKDKPKDDLGDDLEDELKGHKTFQELKGGSPMSDYRQVSVAKVKNNFGAKILVKEWKDGFEDLAVWRFMQPKKVEVPHDILNISKRENRRLGEPTTAVGLLTKCLGVAMVYVNDPAQALFEMHPSRRFEEKFRLGNTYVIIEWGENELTFETSSSFVAAVANTVEVGRWRLYELQIQACVNVQKQRKPEELGKGRTSQEWFVEFLQDEDCYELIKGLDTEFFNHPDRETSERPASLKEPVMKFPESSDNIFSRERVPATQAASRRKSRQKRSPRVHFPTPPRATPRYQTPIVEPSIERDVFERRVPPLEQSFYESRRNPPYMETRDKGRSDAANGDMETLNTLVRRYIENYRKAHGRDPSRDELERQEAALAESI